MATALDVGVHGGGWLGRKGESGMDNGASGCAQIPGQEGGRGEDGERKWAIVRALWDAFVAARFGTRPNASRRSHASTSREA